MAFEKKTWTDRVAEFINRRTLTHEDGTEEIVTVTRNEGSISVEGDAFNAETMNDLEQRIEDEFTTLGKSVSDGKSLVASAITAQGIETATNAEYSTMADNVGLAGNARYAAGVTAADNRANPNSTNYKTGYNNGYSAGVVAGRQGYVPKSSISIWFYGSQTDAGCNREDTLQATVPSGYTTVDISGTMTPAGSNGATYKIQGYNSSGVWVDLISQSSNSFNNTINISGYTLIRAYRTGHATTGNYNISMTFN